MPPPKSDADIVATYVLDALAFAMTTAPENQQLKHKSVLAAIANGRRVKNALARLPVDAEAVDAEAVERVDCALVTRLLNCISASYHEHGYGSKGDAVIFGSLADSTPAGNWIGRDAKPTYYAYLGTIAELNRIIAWNAVPSPKPWSELIQVADHRRVRKGKSTEDQLEPLLSALKSYRPDLPIVHSFTIGHGILELGSLTVCGTSVSPVVSWTDLNSWVAHVALLYDTHRPRDDGHDPRKQPDRNLQYCSAQREFPRWDVRDEDGTGVAVAPFYASEPPGRSTFACFDVLPLPKDDHCTDPESLAAMAEAFNSGAVQGFWKLSWQPPSTQPTELELLSELHQKGWVPGLVRPFDLMRTKKEASKTNEPDVQTDVDMNAVSKSDGPQKVVPADTAVQATLDASLKEQAGHTIYHPKPDSADEYPGRVKDVLHLGSIGQPLSQCRTAGDLLKVMYDLIEVHDHICELGVLHRDISWFNVMCNPKHVVKLHPLLQENKVLPRPCINQILGEGNPEPCVLLADLDHGIKLDGSATPQPGEKIGTPMFVSIEVSKPRSLKYGLPHLTALKKTLLAAGKNADAFKLAFPDGDGTFMSDFELVLQLEAERVATQREGPISPPATRHNRRHDAESIYWVFLWAFSRARPLNGQPLDDSDPDTFELFCRDMLSHSIGGKTGEAGRVPWLIHGAGISDLFHPMLEPFEILFIRMAKYLSIPWFLYCGEVDKGPKGETIHNIMKPNHVHVAFRRLTLAFMLDPANAAALATLLDTQAPRYTRAFEKPWWYRRPPTPEPSDSDAGADAHGKRKVGSTRILPPRKCKRVPGRANAGGNPDPANNDLGNAVAQNNAPQDAAGAAAPLPGGSADNRPRYVASEHQHSESAMALRLMFWKDRELWFGAGVKPDANPQTQAAA